MSNAKLPLAEPSADLRCEVSEWTLATKALWAGPTVPSWDSLFTEAVRRSPEALEEVMSGDLEERRRRGLAWDVGDYIRAAPEILQTERLGKVLLMWVVATESNDLNGAKTKLASAIQQFPELAGAAQQISSLADILHQWIAPETKGAVGDRKGKYELLEFLGRGAFAETWRARDTVLARDVALKIIRPEPGQTVNVERFLMEARALAQVEHPAVVRIHEASQFVDSGEYYLDIQLIGGHESAPAKLRSERFQTLEGCLNGCSVEPRKAAQWIAAVAQGLSVAHARGLTHRDIKPANIILDHEENPVLADFGLAVGGSESEGTEPTRSVGLAGTAAYLAPEVARGEPPSPLSDIYALGATLRALLSGRDPIDLAGQLTDWREVLKRISQHRLPRLGFVVPAIPNTLAAICDRATAFDPAQRYRSASEFANDLIAWLEYRPTKAHSLGNWRLLQLWTWRNLRPVTLAAVIALLATASGGAFVWRLGQERQAALLAEQEARRQRDVAIAAKEITDLQNAFVTRTFNSARGQRGLGGEGADFTVRDTIALALSRINLTFPDKPLVRAAILHFLAQADVAIGEYTRAEDSARNALAVRIENLGAGHADTIATKRLLADMLLRNNQWDQAVVLCRELEGQLRALQLENGYDGLWVRARLAAAAARTGDPSQQIPVLKQICDAYRLLTFSGGIDQQRAMGELVSVYSRVNRLDLAEQIQNEVVDLNRQRLGPNDISTLNSLQALALIVRRQGKLLESIELYRQAVAGFELAVGLKHASCQHVQIELASAALEAQLPDAMELAAQAWQNCQQLAPANNYYLRAALFQARAWRAAGEQEKAETLLRNTWATSQNLSPPSRQSAQQIAEELASLLVASNRKTEAEQIRQEAR